MENSESAWTNDLLTNNTLIDTQHRMIFSACARVSEELKTTDAKPILNELIHYTETHLHDEEKLMASVQYPEISEHRREHEKFRSMVKEIDEYYDGDKLSVLLRVKRLLESWLKDHILTSDLQFSEYYRKAKEEEEVTAA